MCPAARVSNPDCKPSSSHDIHTKGCRQQTVLPACPSVCTRLTGILNLPQAALRSQKSSAAIAEERAAAERAEAEARQREAAAVAAVRDAALVVQRRFRARHAAQQASDLANRQKVSRGSCCLRNHSR